MELINCGCEWLDVYIGAYAKKEKLEREHMNINQEKNQDNKRTIRRRGDGQDGVRGFVMRTKTTTARRSTKKSDKGK